MEKSHSVSMDRNKYICGHCNQSFKHKSSLRRHINTIHNEKRFICGICNKKYTRNVDYISHISKTHPPLIMEQGSENVTYGKPNTSTMMEANTTTHQPQATTSNNHTLEATTNAITGVTDWETILTKDLALSDDESQPAPLVPPKICIGVNTDKSFPTEENKSVNTSPLGIYNLTPTVSALLSTHNLPEEAKTTLKVSKKATTQIGCVPVTFLKNKSAQTDNQKCQSCDYNEHLIVERQQYMIDDAVRNTQLNHVEPVTSREDRQNMPLPCTARYWKWFSRLRPSLIPRTPKEFPKAATPRTHTKSEIKITSKQAETTHSKVRKPSTLTIDNSTYEAICSRKPTRPTLVTSPRKLVLPPPPQDGSWSYTTTRF